MITDEMSRIEGFDFRELNALTRNAASVEMWEQAIVIGRLTM
jgi:hypothetical protein